ncbi:Lysine Methyltransferase 2D [Paramecium bursaria]
MINTSVSTIKIAGEFCKFYEDQNKQKYLGIKLSQKSQQFFQYEIDANLEDQKFRRLHEMKQEIGYFYYDKKHKTLPELQNEIRLMKEEKIQQQVEGVMQQIVLSFFILHSKGLMGRVINYENIVISEKGNVLFYDFGFCTDAPNNPDEKEYDLKLDVWLLGNILYYLIKGKEAEFKNGQQIVLNTDKKIDRKLVDLINQMLLNDKKQRSDFSQIIKYLNNIPAQGNLIEFYEKRFQQIEGKIKDRILFREITSQIMPPNSNVQVNLYSNVVIVQNFVSNVEVINHQVDENLKKQINNLLKYYFTPEQMQDYNNVSINETARIQKLYKILKDQYDQETREGKLHLFEILIMLKYIQFPGNQIWSNYNNLQQLKDLARDDQKFILDIKR